jgi:hypothetical protein
MTSCDADSLGCDLYLLLGSEEEAIVPLEHQLNGNWQVKTKVIRKTCPGPLCVSHVHADYTGVEPGPLHRDAGSRRHTQSFQCL